MHFDAIFIKQDAKTWSTGVSDEKSASSAVRNHRFPFQISENREKPNP